MAWQARTLTWDNYSVKFDDGQIMAYNLTSKEAEDLAQGPVQVRDLRIPKWQLHAGDGAKDAKKRRKF